MIFHGDFCPWDLFILILHGAQHAFWYFRLLVIWPVVDLLRRDADGDRATFLSHPRAHALRGTGGPDAD
jgi:hypothetical protein